MKLEWLAGPDNDGNQEVVGTVEDTPWSSSSSPDSFSYTGDVQRIKTFVDNYGYARKDLTPRQLLEYILNESPHGEAGRVRRAD